MYYNEKQPIVYKSILKGKLDFTTFVEQRRGVPLRMQILSGIFICRSVRTIGRIDLRNPQMFLVYLFLHLTNIKSE